MAELLLIPLLALVAGAAWVLGLRWLGITTDPAVLAWNRLTRLRGLAGREPLGERVGRRLPLLRRIQDETDVGRLLAVSGRSETATGWLLRTAGVSGAVLGAFLVVDEVTVLAEGRQVAPAGLGLIATGAVAALAYTRLRSAATTRRLRLGRGVADALPHLAVMTYHHRLPVSEALLVFARCQRDHTLHDLLAGGSWRALVEQDESPEDAMAMPGSALVYERIGHSYGVPMLTALGGALRMINERGLSSQEVLTRLARDTLAERAAEARVASAQTKTLIVVPMGLMIVPVLLLIGAPLVASLSGLFGR